MIYLRKHEKVPIFATSIGHGGKRVVSLPREMVDESAWENGCWAYGLSSVFIVQMKQKKKLPDSGWSPEYSGVQNLTYDRLCSRRVIYSNILCNLKIFYHALLSLHVSNGRWKFPVLRPSVREWHAGTCQCIHMVHQSPTHCSPLAFSIQRFGHKWSNETHW